VNDLDELQDSNAFMEALGSMQTPVNRTAHHHKPTNNNLSASGANKVISKLASTSGFNKLTIETNEVHENSKVATLSPIPSNISPTFSHGHNEKPIGGHQLNNTNNNLVNINNNYNRVIQIGKLPTFLIILNHTIFFIAIFDLI
jgi:hypothetical protein